MLITVCNLFRLAARVAAWESAHRASCRLRLRGPRSVPSRVLPSAEAAAHRQRSVSSGTATHLAGTRGAESSQFPLKKENQGLGTGSEKEKERTSFGKIIIHLYRDVRTS